MSYLVCRHPESSSWAILLGSKSRYRFVEFIDSLLIERANAVGVELRREPTIASIVNPQLVVTKPAGKQAVVVGGLRLAECHIDRTIVACQLVTSAF